jgi:CubicO group peptidase (beta-lactamase class C family)
MGMRSIILVLGIVFLVGIQCNAQNDWWFELRPTVVVGDSSFSHSLEDAMSEFNVHGVAIATIQRGELHGSCVFLMEKNGLQEPSAGVNSKFQAGSISKTVAALGVLVCVEKNDNISLDDPVNKHLKRWFVADSLFDAPITIRQLLSHTAGLNVHGFPGYKSIKKAVTLVEVLNGEGNTDAVTPIFSPDSTGKYSGGGYEVLQLMVEDVTGMPFSEYLEKEVLIPLKMTNSTYRLLDKDACPECAFAYNQKGKQYKAGWYQYPESAAAGLWTTAEDLAAFFIHLGSIHNGESGVISLEMLTEMITPVKNNYGFGLFIEERDGGLYIGHSGKNRGFSNEALFNLKTKNGIVVMTDSDRGFNLIREIEISAPGDDKWLKEEQIVINQIDLSDEDQKQFTGKYVCELPNGQSLKAKVTLKDGLLYCKAKGRGITYVMYPVGDQNYIEDESGAMINFKMYEDQMAMIFGGRMRFIKQ